MKPQTAAREIHNLNGKWGADLRTIQDRQRRAGISGESQTRLFALIEGRAGHTSGIGPTSKNYIVSMGLVVDT